MITFGKNFIIAAGLFGVSTATSMLRSHALLSTLLIATAFAQEAACTGFAKCTCTDCKSFFQPRTHTRLPSAAISGASAYDPPSRIIIQKVRDDSEIRTCEAALVIHLTDSKFGCAPRCGKVCRLEYRSRVRRLRSGLNPVPRPSCLALQEAYKTANRPNLLRQFRDKIRAPAQKLRAILRDPLLFRTGVCGSEKYRTPEDVPLVGKDSRSDKSYKLYKKYTKARDTLKDAYGKKMGFDNADSRVYTFMNTCIRLDKIQ